MKKIAVLFGGKSVEHEVSIITGMQVMENMDKSKYQPVPIYITKEGRWLSDPSFTDFKVFKNKEWNHGKEVFFQMGQGGKLYTIEAKSGRLFSKGGSSLEVVETIDMVFPALHGTYGEDGKIQGLLELLNLPYVGADVLAAAVGMDKVMMKKVFEKEGIPILPYTWAYRSTWEKVKTAFKNKVKELGYPVFVKPSNLGSSIGITKVMDESTLEEAVELALHYDDKVLVEQGAHPCRELNMAVLGYQRKYETSQIEEPLTQGEVYDYSAKYMSGSKSKGKNSRNFPALSPELQEELETYGKMAMDAIQGTGVARLDYILENDKCYVNEINTMPGSISFYLWEVKGISIQELINILLEQGQQRREEKKKTGYTIDVNLLDQTTYGSKL